MRRREFLAAPAAALPLLGADIPRPAGELSVPTPAGQKLRLADFRGKVVIVEFLMTTCPGCQRAAGLISQLVKELRPRGLEAMGVAVDPGAAMAVAGFVRNYGVNFPVGYAGDEVLRNFMQIPIMVRYTVPQLAFVDRNGVVREQRGGQTDASWFSNEEKNLRASVLRLLDEGASKGGVRKAKASK